VFVEDRGAPLGASEKPAAPMGNGTIKRLCWGELTLEKKNRTDRHLAVSIKAKDQKNNQGKEI